MSVARVMRIMSRRTSRALSAGRPPRMLILPRPPPESERPLVPRAVPGCASPPLASCVLPPLSRAPAREGAVLLTHWPSAVGGRGEDRGSWAMLVKTVMQWKFSWMLWSLKVRARSVRAFWW